MRSPRIAALGALVALGGCGNPLAAIVNGPPRPLRAALLAAYLRTVHDLESGPAARICADFSPPAAARIAIAGHARTCTARMRRFLQGGTSGGFGRAERMFENKLRMVDVIRVGDRAAATLSYAGGPSRKRSHFRLISGRWRVADVPTVVIHRGCSPSGPPCASSAVSAFYF